MIRLGSCSFLRITGNDATRECSGSADRVPPCQNQSALVFPFFDGITLRNMYFAEATRMLEQLLMYLTQPSRP
jgi:hypothetical protein